MSGKLMSGQLDELLFKEFMKIPKSEREKSIEPAMSLTIECAFASTREFAGFRIHVIG